MKHILTLLCLFALTLLSHAAFAAEDPVCLQCHAGLEGRLQEPVELWHASVHAENGISCHDCHGGDPADFDMAMSPERGFLGVPEKDAIPAFCGRCHVGVQEDYLASAHGAALGSGGPQCVTCHRNHSIQRASTDLINEQDCSRCHEYDRAARIKSAVASTDDRIDALEKGIEALKFEGVATGDRTKGLFSLRNRFHRLFHSVNLEKVEGETEGFHHEMDEIEQWISDWQTRLKQRSLAGFGVAGLFILMGLIALFLRKTYEDEGE